MKAHGPPRSPPLFALVFMSMFGFIGLAVLIFMWTQPRDAFGAPPLFFRVFASFIAIAFMAVGFGVPLSELRRRRGQHAAGEGSGSSGPTAAGPAGYRCPQCGAGLGREAEVSPSGDVKCPYCQKWWNVHRGCA